MSGGALVRRSPLRLAPDPSRVVNRLFVAGEELLSGSSRASPVMARVLALDDAEVDRILAATIAGFGGRHPHLEDDLREHFDQIGDRLGEHGELSEPRRLLIGAYATSEVAVEAAALCNPSIVAHPDQDGLGPGELRFILSLRAIGEGHVSSIEFRTGVTGPDGAFRVDDPGPFAVVGRHSAPTYDRATLLALLAPTGAPGEVLSMVVGGLPSSFSAAQLDDSIAALHPQVLTRRSGRELVERIRNVAAMHYRVTFPADSTVAERVLRPWVAAESNGMEDARFVRFVDDDGTVTYYATYTAFDGAAIAPRLVRTTDFASFEISQLAGKAATNKGLALFPRRVAGRFVALSRWDRESNAVTTSADGRIWDAPVDVQVPEYPWELIQVGNCGSPIETDEGWLVLTHGVGPMRSYVIGAMLLDLDDPTRVVARLREPLLCPDDDQRDGYVPNVVYTCGALLHAGTLVVPYAYGDRVTTVATVALAPLLDRLLGR